MARIVLVADDSPTIQKRAIGFLKGDGYEVETVSNGVAAIKRLATLRPAVIIADVCMPGRDGYEVCEHVKKTPEYSHIPVVLLMSDMEPYDSAKGTAVRANGILKKPFEGRELITLVGKLADEYEASAQALEEPPAASSPTAGSSIADFEMTPEPDETPTIVQAPEADFSAHSSGVAFSEPVGEDGPAFPLESHADVGDFPFGAQHAGAAPQHENDFEFPTLHTEEPTLNVEPHSDPELEIGAHTAQAEAETPTFFEAIAAPAAALPVFLEDHSTPAIDNNHSPAMGTAIFRTPIEIADPVWKEESLHVASEPESAGAVALEPQFITEEHEVSIEGFHNHPHPHEHSDEDGHELPHEHSHATNATNLGSFSLDDATAGQVRFASEVPEVVYADESAEASALAASVSEVTEHGEHLHLPEVIYADPAAEELALVPVAEEEAATESEPNVPVSENAVPPAPAESAPEVVYSDDALPIKAVAPAELVAEESHEEEPSLEPAAKADTEEVVAAPEEENAEDAHATETTPVEASHAETEPAPALEEPAPIQAAVEAVHEVAEPVAKPEHAAETLPSKPAVDHNLVYSIVHKVVAHMAPSFLGDEAKADMAKHLAEQIAAELVSDSSAHS